MGWTGGRVLGGSIPVRTLGKEGWEGGGVLVATWPSGILRRTFAVQHTHTHAQALRAGGHPGSVLRGPGRWANRTAPYCCTSPSLPVSPTPQACHPPGLKASKPGSSMQTAMTVVIPCLSLHARSRHLLAALLAHGRLLHHHGHRLPGPVLRGRLPVRRVLGHACVDAPACVAAGSVRSHAWMLGVAAAMLRGLGQRALHGRRF